MSIYGTGWDVTAEDGCVMWPSGDVYPLAVT